MAIFNWIQGARSLVYKIIASLKQNLSSFRLTLYS